ncbi:CRISPR-associated helicase Cas3' [Cryomorpha ignava]|uniref:CRISPR-associated helicase Cas3 n=1 Tax=Cryomorpha ignava TaxID=101383 RepID=A0A7K3WMB0_9FLAO|nr:CRISPR-associated helicase Cas3' [Cryomorpha ignava]NEN22779.1 CRISPR-associated helicase Cas3' [Cryomorpha ignava]
MTFYSHSKTDAHGEAYGSKELKVHVNGVKEKALFHLSENLDLGFPDNELKELIEVIVDFHDLGKYTSYFQNYLLQKKPIDNLLKRHAQIGGFAAYNSLIEKNEKKALIALYLIFLHHSQLIDILEITSKLDYDLDKIIPSQIDDLKISFQAIESDLNFENIKILLVYTEKRKLRKGYRHWALRNASIQDYFLINYLFSLLIEGDKLDASDTLPYHLKAILHNAVDKHFGKPEKGNQNLKEMSNNELRNYCRATVISNLEDSDILNRYIFTLTAPTGIGKTMTALDFSLKLKAKIKKVENIETRIIYALPFINIIEQALNEYQKILPKENRILGHYQYADIFGDSDEKDNLDGAEQGYNQKAMALDTWQADVVITSFVQFFETLIGNRNKLLKKFNHFANAIIILDEVQTLRLDQMPLLGSVLYYLTKFLKTRIILMTATRPKIFELAQSEILNEEGEKANPKELLTNYEEVFAVFKRTSIHPLLDDLNEEKADRTIEFVSNIFTDKWNSEKSCLLVCNTVGRSIELYKCIAEFLEENELSNPLYYLSTNIIPAHRFDRISEIKKDINVHRSPILVATQVVEAGVDLDFDMGFRDIGPIDSIIQVAGRINRNNDLNRKHSPLYIVDFDKSMTIRIYGRFSYDQSRMALKTKATFGEEEYLNLINQYFDGVAGRNSFDVSRCYFNSLKTLKYTADDKSECPIGSFRIIEESDRYVPVFIEFDETAADSKKAYLKKIVNEMSSLEFNRDWKLKFQQCIISAPKYLCDHLEPINEYEENILCVPQSEIAEFYNEQTGLIRNIKEEKSVYIL